MSIIIIIIISMQARLEEEGSQKKQELETEDKEEKQLLASRYCYTLSVVAYGYTGINYRENGRERQDTYHTSQAGGGRGPPQKHTLHSRSRCM